MKLQYYLHLKNCYFLGGVVVRIKLIVWLGLPLHRNFLKLFNSFSRSFLGNTFRASLFSNVYAMLCSFVVLPPNASISFPSGNRLRVGTRVRVTYPFSKMWAAYNNEQTRLMEKKRKFVGTPEKGMPKHGQTMLPTKIRNSSPRSPCLITEE